MESFEEPKPVGVSLDRNTAFESGLEYDKENFYRMIGERGYEDFLETGLFQPAQDTKQEYQKAYFFKGHPLNRYAVNGSRIQYFIEVKPKAGMFTEDESGYPYPNRPLTSQDKIRVYRHSETDGIEIVFDSFDGE